MIYPPRSIAILFAGMAAVAIAVSFFGGTAKTSVQSTQETYNNVLPASGGSADVQQALATATPALATTSPSPTTTHASAPAVQPTSHSVVGGRTDRESREDD